MAASLLSFAYYFVVIVGAAVVTASKSDSLEKLIHQFGPLECGLYGSARTVDTISAFVQFNSRQRRTAQSWYLIVTDRVMIF